MGTASAAPGAIVVIGPAGAGKTTVGRALAAALRWRFYDADAFHSPANVERIRSGVALTDTERGPWLAELRALLDDARARHDPVVLACSALRESYRVVLAPANAAADAPRFVYLRATPALLRHRLEHRVGHFASVELLDSQLAALEEPQSGEALCVDASLPPDAIVRAVREAFAV